MQKYVALKFLRSDCYDGTYDIYELEMLQHIQQKSQSSTSPGRNRIIQLLDHFNHKIKTESHVCFVFPVLGNHLGLQTARYEKYRLPVRAVKEVSRQLLQGLDFLHRECGIIHTGRLAMDCECINIDCGIWLIKTYDNLDLKPSNILLELEDPETVVATYIEQEPLHTFKPETEESTIVTPLSEAITTPLISEMKDIRVRIIDLGVCTLLHRLENSLRFSTATNIPS